MLIYAGIDEAGYGPMLGPLCVATSVFVVEDHDPAEGPPDLWKRLSKAVCRKAADRRRRIAVDDSKKLKLANDGAVHPLRHLERGVLSFLAGASETCDRNQGEGASGSAANATTGGGKGFLPCTDGDLFDRLGVSPCVDVPWYASSCALPVAHEADELAIAVAMMRRCATAAKVWCSMLACESIDAGEFNELLERFGNKANVNFGAVTKLVDRIWRRWPDAHPRVVVDRQGGRAYYLRPLQMVFPDAFITVLGETDTISRYRLEQNGSTVTISFEAESESRHLPTALASMTAKYVRELLMGRLNRYFRDHLPDVRPTAGYVQDARRYVNEIRPIIERLGVDRRRLVRNA